MALFAKKPTPPQKWPQTLIPAEQEMFVQGVSQFQTNLSKAGKQPQHYALVGQPQSMLNPDSVQVCAILKDGLYQVGSLKSGEDITALFQQMALQAEANGQLLTVVGYQEHYFNSARKKLLGLRLQVPSLKWMKENLA